MKIAIFGRSFNPEFRQFIIEFFDQLQVYKAEVLIYRPFYDFLINSADCEPVYNSLFEGEKDAPEDVDFLISIGGDGTFLESIQFLKKFDIPVIGLNSGRLGFLANISKEEITEAFEAIISGNYEVEERSMIILESEKNPFGKFNFALNDASIQKKDSVMITVDAFLDDEYLNTYWTDGLIVSTPTGSTAYSLSIGGPILTPGSENFVIAPIASHNLSVRPIVIPDNKVIRLEVNSRSGGFLVTVDNRTQKMNGKDNTFYIRKAPFQLRMIRLPFNNFYSTIRNKLMWGADKRN
jgi:NAD+ kinase